MTSKSPALSAWSPLQLGETHDDLTLPTPEGGGFSGYACGNPLRWRLTGLPGPTAWGAWSDEQAITKPCAHSIAHMFEEALSPRLMPGACAPRM
jgi:hypothetical protein